MVSPRHPLEDLMTTGPDILLERVRAATSDEYEIDREIGRGGMAAVFLGRDIALARRVAIKVMLPDLMTVQGIQDRFVIEARTAAHLDHPGIVTVYAVKQRAGLLFIVMKYIEGHTLEGVLRSQGRLDPVAVALIGSRVAEALHFAHAEGVVHRDVKPSNIMIDMRGRPVVTDFGIARIMTAQSITVAGSMLGTPTHMSPEQCRGLPATAASDQYSLGVTIYEMLTGRVPFTGSLFELITAHREQSPPALSEFVGGVDPALEHTVMRMLAKDAAERWSSLTEVVQRLAVHTTSYHGEESLRATLSLSGSFGGTPERAVGAVDVLTPPGRISTPPTPVGGSPLSPLPLSIPAGPLPTAATASGQRPAAAVTERDEPAIPTRTRRGLMIGGLGAVLLAVVALVAVWAASSDDNTPAAAADSTPATAQTQPPTSPTPAVNASAVPDSVARDSIARELGRDSAARTAVVRDSLTRDSTAKALAARDSIRADSIARVTATATTDSSAKASAAAARRRASPPRAPQIRPESVTVQCVRLLERASLGERLTEAERALLQRRCPK